MRFSEEVERFLRPGAERLVELSELLAARGLPFAVVKTGGARHLIMRLGHGKLRLVVAAHYDRFPGSPGVLDNSCACLQLVEFAARTASGGVRASSPILLAFTDAEETPARGGAGRQGSFSLARALRSVLEREMGPTGAGRSQSGGPEDGLERGERAPPVLVLDVTGRGDRLVLSSTPGELLARHGLSEGRAAAGHRGLVELARRAARRARLPAPERLPLPWSDDLGLVLGGLPALVVSLLPEAELAELRAGGRPATWDFLHSPGDGPELAWDSSFDLMARFLDAVAVEART